MKTKTVHHNCIWTNLRSNVQTVPAVNKIFEKIIPIKHIFIKPNLNSFEVQFDRCFRQFAILECRQKDKCLLCVLHNLIKYGYLFITNKKHQLSPAWNGSHHDMIMHSILNAQTTSEKRIRKHWNKMSV